MKDSAAEVLQFVRENDVKFIRLAFCDITGSQKNIAIMAQELPRAFERGIGFESPNVLGLERIQHADLFLVPDCSTISILPWRPAHERVMRMYCDVCYADGTPFEDTGRAILQRGAKRHPGGGLRREGGPPAMPSRADLSPTLGSAPMSIWV